MNTSAAHIGQYDAALREQLENYLEGVRQTIGVPGISVALSTRGRHVSAGVGLVAVDEPSTLTGNAEFHLGCVTKLLAAVVTLELAWSGRLDLNVPVEEYLPEFRGTGYGHSVALVHLLSHSSGFPGLPVFAPKARHFTWDSLVEYLRNAPQRFVPGTVYSHEHIGSVVIGQIIQRVTGKHILELIREMIFEPLNLLPGRVDTGDRTSSIQAGQHDFCRLSGSYVRVEWSKFFNRDQLPLPEFWQSSLSAYTLSVVDLVTIGEALMSAATGGGNDYNMLSTATLSQIQRPVVELPFAVDGPVSELMPVSFGLGAARYANGFYGISSLSVGQCIALRFDPTSQVCAAAGCNASNRYLPASLLDGVCRTVADVLPTEPLRQPFRFELRELVGVYRGYGKQRATLHLENERLVCEFGSGRSQGTLRVEVELDEDGCAIMHLPAPTLNLAFFRDIHSGGFGMMVGPMAYKKSTDER